ncbi:MAG: substrate-binding domain-containing protein [Bacteroidota bacterium]
MKKTVFTLLLLAMILWGCGSNQTKNKGTNPNSSNLQGTIIINGSDVLYPLAMRWAKTFKSENTGVAIELKSTCSDNAIRNLKAGLINIAMVSRPLSAAEQAQGLLAIPVAMDAVLPVICFDNNNIQQIMLAGVTKSKLAAAFSGKIKTWGQLLNTKSTDPIEVHKLADSTGTTQTWANFLGVKPSQIIGTTEYSNQSMADVLVTKKFGLGYCSMSVVFDLNTNFTRRNLKVIPIDLNSSGQADDNELVFDKLDDFKSIVSAAKYPSPPVRNLFLVIKTQPINPAVNTFVKWTLGIGQNYFKDFGLVTIDKKTANEALKLLK